MRLLCRCKLHGDGRYLSWPRSISIAFFEWFQTIWSCCIGTYIVSHCYILCCFISHYIIPYHAPYYYVIHGYVITISIGVVCDRYFCQQQFLEEGRELDRMTNKKLEWNLANELSDFIPTVSKFNPSKARAQRGLSTATRPSSSTYSSQGHLTHGLGGEVGIRSSGGEVGSMVVTVIAARGLPLKEISSSLNLGGPFTLVLPKLFVQVDTSTCTPLPLTLPHHCALPSIHTCLLFPPS